LKKLLILILILIFWYNESPLNAQNRATASFLTIGGDVNGILYFANFKQFEGVDNCCTSFKNTFGLNYNVHAGYELNFSKPWIGMKLRLDLSIAYSGLSITLKEQNAFANIITGNTSTKAVSEFKIEPNINAVKFDPGMFFYPFDDIPLAFRLGFQAGILSGKTYNQSETLIAPSNAFFENGTKTRSLISGTIPNATSMLFALSVGARYEAWKSGNFTVNPQIRFNYGLNNIVSGLNWKVSEIQAGVTIAYNIPKADVIPPLPPPGLQMPDAPLPPLPGKLDLTIKAYYNGEEKKDNLINIPMINTVYSKTNYYLPIVFYKPNTSEVVNPEEDSQHSIKILNFITGYFKSADKAITLTIKSSSLPDEDSAVVNQRISDYVSIIAPITGISRIHVEKEEFTPGREPQEVIDEKSNIRFILSDGTSLFKENSIISQKYDFIEKDNTLMIKPSVNADSAYSFLGSIDVGGKSVSLPESGFSLNLRDALGQEPHELTYRAKATVADFFNRKLEKETEVRVIPRITQTNIHDNEVNDGEKTYSEYILCYFDFNSYEVSQSIPEVLRLAQDAIGEGRKITLIPSTDNFGTEKYNKALAVNRAKSAIELVQSADRLNSELISINYPDNFKYSNSTPIGRHLNRTVQVRVYK
jgi:outer membrane protein OmpA-like peptidoglycan-associated protein